MQFLSALITLSALASAASACLTFDGTLAGQAPRMLTGKLVDNDIEVCTFNEDVDQAKSVWIQGKCIKGVTAYIMTDGTRMGYFNGEHNYEFGVDKQKGELLIGNKGMQKLTAKNYGC